MKNALKFLIAIYATKVFAGPPFITDDPSPLNFHQSQFYLFATGVKTKDTTSLAIPALELGYGLLPNIEMSLTLPVSINLPTDSDMPNSAGLGDVQIAAKYRFLKETLYRPEIAFAPAYIIPTGDNKRNLGNGRSWSILPIWLQKTGEKWLIYGGGGLALNSSPGMRNFLFGGCVLQRKINEEWSLGGELFAQGANTRTSTAYTLLNLGGIYHITEQLSFLFSAGKNIAGERNVTAYIGVNWQSK